MVELTPADLSRTRPVPLVNVPDPDRSIPHLPTSLTSFVGRAREVAGVVDLVRRPGIRLITLTGPGGVGKTRLAVWVAEEVAPDFPDGVWFVALAPIRDPALVTTTTARALGVRDSATRSVEEGLQEFLRDRRTLLVMDNFEHLLDAGPQIADLVSRCPHLVVLITSRTLLRLSGEHAFPVPPLSLPDPTVPRARLAEVEAVQLFTERARVADPGFALTDDNAGAVAAICLRLDGLPLAIELAAVKVRVLPPPALLARLTRALPLLTGGPRDEPARLRTMREAIAWSDELLAEQDRTLLRRLAVFVGGFTLEAAEAVVGGHGMPTADVLAGVESLAEQSLVHRLDVGAGESRFGMLETVREYAVERLETSGEEPAARRAHADHALALAEEAEPHLLMPGQEPWLERLGADHDNLRAALAWFEQTGDAEAMLRLACALDRFWFVRGHFGEGRAWQERALALADGDTPAPLRAKAMGGAGWLAVFNGDVRRAEALIAQSLAIWRGLGNREQTAVSVLRLGMACTAQERYGEAAAWTEEALALFEELGPATISAGPFATIALSNLGNIAYARGEYARASERYAEALARQRVMSFTWGAGISLIGLGDLARVRGDTIEAAAHYRESLDHWRVHGDPWGAISALVGLADVALAWGQSERATRLLAAVKAQTEVIGRSVDPLDHQNEARTLAAVRAVLSVDRFTAVWAEGRGLSFAAAVDEALRVGPAPSVPAEATGRMAAHRLSPRELEVLRLLAEGHSNREIATTLFVSPRTVDNHVSNLLAKLDVRSSRAAVAAARRLGVV